MPFANEIQASPVVIIDAETEYFELSLCITCLGFYKVGSKQIIQIIAPQPYSPDSLDANTIFRYFIKNGRYTLAAYNKSYESQLLDLKIDLELMPRPFIAKERFITIESLSVESGSNLPSWKTNWKLICQHNLCCILKNIVLYLGRETYCRFDFINNYVEGLNGKFGRG